MAPAVAKAAMDSGVATRPIADLDAYREQLDAFVYHSGTTMEPVFAAARTGAQARRLRRRRGRARAARGAGRRRRGPRRTRSWSAAPTSSRRASSELGLRLEFGEDLRRRSTSRTTRATASSGPQYYKLAQRKGVSRAQAQEDMRSRPTLIGAMLVHRGDADAMLCGTSGDIADHLRYIRDIIGMREGVRTLGDDADADPARPAAVHLRHARQSRPQRRCRSPR